MRGVSPLNRKLLRDLWHMRGQALAIALVIGCGVAVVVMSFGTMISLDETRAAYYERYRFADAFAHVKRAPQFVAERLAAIPGVARVDTRIAVGVTLAVAGMDEPASARVLSLPATGRPVLNDVALRAGRRPAPGSPQEVLISEAFAQSHDFGPGDQVTAVINGRKRVLDIVGIALTPEYVYTLGPGQLMPDDRRFGIIWMSRDALEAAYDLKGAFNDVSFALMRGATHAAVFERVDRLLEDYGGVGAYGREDQTSDAFVVSELDQLRGIGGVIPPIFLGIAAFLLNIVVSRLIETEREQIGLLKAFGYGDYEVGWHYLKFVLVLTAVGVTFGLLAGIWLGGAVTAVYAEHFGFPFLYYQLDTGVFAAAALLSFAASIGSTIFVVRRAAMLPPAVAMAPPTPTRYRVSLFERLGLGRGLDQPTRMVIRHIVRWPWRATLSTVGVATAVMILIGSTFTLDAIDHMIDVFFFQSQRQDVIMTFEEVKPKRVIEDVRHLPGVLTVEPFRAVPVRIRKGHLSERLSIMGTEKNADLSWLIDMDLRPVEMPTDGLVATSELAKLLDLSAGATVIVEAMEGRRPTVEIPVAAVVEEYIGVSAYMDLSALNRLMGEAPVVSGVHLAVDSNAEAELYRTVKDLPIVAGVTLRRAAVESFRETIAETMTTIISFYMMLAAMIAFGVLYNGARVSLSQRGRELASLRVLGFTNGEVTFILLAELGVLTLIALPVGCLMGYGMAWVISIGLETELFRIPLVVERATYGLAMLSVVVSALVSGVIVGVRVARLDLIAVLKSRE